MSFAFGFMDDDLGGDIKKETCRQNETQGAVKALDTFSATIAEENLPKYHTLEALLSSLTDLRLTFDKITSPQGNEIYRRDLFDIKHQVMCEEDLNAQVSAEVLLKDGRESDLEKNFYEGGFKIWEGSFDLIDKLASLNDSEITNFNSFLELGCGTALPTCYMFNKVLRTQTSREIKLILSDFNHEVLRLCTLPNLIIQWAMTLHPSILKDLSSNDEEGPMLEENELQLTKKLLSYFKDDLAQRSISLKFVSGSWGNQFNELIRDEAIDFIITSETIYSPDSLPVVAETVIEILSLSQKECKTCLIAAKNIYFGVGGSVIEFINYINMIPTVSHYKVSVEEIGRSQVKRSIVSIAS